MQLTARMQSDSSRSSLRSAGSKKKWIIRPSDPRAESIAESLNLSPLAAQLLINRGITDAETAALFLRPKLSGLISPEKIPGVKPAVGRIKKAIKAKEKITVYGDYDVDGITGVAILEAILRLLGAEVDYYIPHRIDEGYGLNTEAVESLAASGTKLLITVDCGVTATNTADLAARLGVDLIITDHHQPEQLLPKAVSIVHPAMDKSYPNQDSAGAMVAFKLAWAVANEFNAGKKLRPALRDFMINATSLAAMGTVADIMDLRGENRILTSYGLKSLPHCKIPGMQSLIETAGLSGKGLDSFHIGFRLAPMLNAAGRMGHARLAVELLTSDNPVRSMQLAEYLKSQNSERQKCEKKIFKEACEMLVRSGLNHPDHKSIVIAAENWHVGVIGVVASRIAEKFFRPAIIIRLPKPSADAAGSIAQGSARSIEGFDLLAGINASSDHLATFGGHKMAAGLTLQADRVPLFAKEFEDYARENLKTSDCIPKLNIDAVTQLCHINKRLINELQLLAPFGQGNPKPRFATKGVRLASTPRRVGAKGDHLQLAVTDNTNAIQCIAFGMGRLEKKLLEHDFFNIAYEADINTYNGSSNVQLTLKDIQFE